MTESEMNRIIAEKDKITVANWKDIKMPLKSWKKDVRQMRWNIGDEIFSIS